MKQLIFCLILFCFGCHGLLFSQDYVQTQKMLEAKYDNVYFDKDNNCFEVKLNGKKGICDLRGKEIIAPDKYTYISTYEVKNGYYEVSIGDKKGICDLRGKEIIAPDKYTYISTYEVKNGYYEVSIGDKKGLLDLTGRVIISPAYTQVFLSKSTYYEDYIFIKNDNYEGICDLKGNIIIHPDKYTSVGLADSYFPVWINDKRGACDLKGNEVVPCQFSEIKYNFYEKKLMVKQNKTDTGYIDYAGYTPFNLHQTSEQSKVTVNTIQNRYKTDQIAYHFHSAANGYYSVKLKDKEGICDLNGRELMAPDRYNSVIYYKRSGYYLVMNGDKAGICDLSTKEIISPDKFNRVYKSDDNYIVHKGDKAGLCDLTGKEFISPDKYTEISTYEVKDGYYKVKIGDKAGLLDLTGKEIISPDKYTDIETYSVSDGFYRVSIGDKKGLLDLTGKEIISPDKYTEISTYEVKDGYYKVKIGDKAGLLDLTGKEIISPDKYTEIRTYEVKDGYYKVKIGDKTGLCDLTGKEIIPCKYDGVVLLGTYYSVRLNNKKGACDLSGKEIIPCEYDDLIYSDGFKYKNSGGGWELIGEAPRLVEHDKGAASTSSSLTETKTSTATISSTANATAETQAKAIHTEEKPLFFLNKTYVFQSNDYSKMHMVSFYGEKDFLYMVFDGQTQTETGRQYGEFTHQNGHIKIAFKDNSVSEFDIKMINSNKVSFQFVGTTTPQIYAVALSADDLFSVNLAQYWGSHNSSPQSTYQPYQQPQQQYQQKVTQRVVCPSCNGTGKTCILKTVPTYGNYSNVKKRCNNCNELVSNGSVHVQQRCYRCQGKGYVER